MKSCLSLLVFAVIEIISLLLPPGIARGNELLIENFSNLSPSRWAVNNPNGYVGIVDDSYLRLSSPVGYFFPYVSLTNFSFPINNYEIEIRFRLSGYLNYGSGVILSNRPIPYGDYNVFTLADTLFQVWPDENSNIWINTTICSKGSVNCIFPSFLRLKSTSLDSWSTFKLTSDTENSYKVFLNGEQIFISHPSEERITNLWFGNPERTHTETLKPTIDIDYLYITSGNMVESYPLIIIPGLGASWDVGAMLTGSENGDWKIPSFVSVYDGLKNSLVNAGYFDSGDKKNLFTFSYDWRKPLSALAERLNTYIETNISPGEKVNIVGHSMGGLVARAYAQTYGGSRINKIVTVGTPNMGAVSAYGPWEGAVALDDSWWSKIALELTTHFGFVMGESPVQTIQRLVPSLKDLLPTFDYLSRNGSIVPWTSMNSKNEYLSGLNQNITSINPLTTAIFSTDVQTNSLIKVVSHTDGDLGSWVDGKPIENPFIKSDGDGTVTAMSSKGPFSNILQGSGWHGELVTKQNNIEKIFSILGLDTSKVMAGDYDTREGVFVAALRSPGSLEVCNINLTKCNNQLGIYLSDYKLFLLPGYDHEELVVKVKEGGLGLYKLHLGSVDETANWVVVSGEITKINQVDNYRVLSNQNGLVLGGIPNNKQNCKYDTWKLYSQLKFKNQGECVSFVERNEKAKSKFFWWI